MGLSMGELADLVGGESRVHVRRGPGPPEPQPKEAGAGGSGAECPGEGRGCAASHRGHEGAVGTDGCAWNQPERGGAAGGISPAHLSQIMNGQRTPSGDVLRRLHGVLFAPTTQELVAPVELKVMAWKKGGRNGVVVKGAGGPGGDAIRTGGRVPWGAEVEFAYTSGYDSRGRVSVNHLVDERGYGVMLNKQEPDDV